MIIKIPIPAMMIISKSILWAAPHSFPWISEQPDPSPVHSRETFNSNKKVRILTKECWKYKKIGNAIKCHNLLWCDFKIFMKSQKSPSQPFLCICIFFVIVKCLDKQSISESPASLDWVKLFAISTWLLNFSCNFPQSHHLHLSLWKYAFPLWGFLLSLS